MQLKLLYFPTGKEGSFPGKEGYFSVCALDRFPLLDGQQEGGVRQAAQQVHPGHRCWKVCRQGWPSISKT